NLAHDTVGDHAVWDDALTDHTNTDCDAVHRRAPGAHQSKEEEGPYLRAGLQQASALERRLVPGDAAGTEEEIAQQGCGGDVGDAWSGGFVCHSYPGQVQDRETAILDGLGACRVRG